MWTLNRPPVFIQQGKVYEGTTKHYNTKHVFVVTSDWCMKMHIHIYTSTENDLLTVYFITCKPKDQIQCIYRENWFLILTIGFVVRPPPLPRTHLPLRYPRQNSRQRSKWVSRGPLKTVRRKRTDNRGVVCWCVCVGGGVATLSGRGGGGGGKHHEIFKKKILVSNAAGNHC